jgi:hypothetical protein
VGFTDVYIELGTTQDAVISGCLQSCGNNIGIRGREVLGIKAAAANDMIQCLLAKNTTTKTAFPGEHLKVGALCSSCVDIPTTETKIHTRQDKLGWDILALRTLMAGICLIQKVKPVSPGRGLACVPGA